MRMGADKASLRVAGGALIDHVLGQVTGLFDEILISVSRGQTAGAFPWRIVEDAAPGQGPMAGILAGLNAAKNDLCAVLACDIPDIDTRLLGSLVRRAEGRDIVVPVTPEGLLEPLFAVYSRGLVPRIEESLQAGEYSLLPLIEAARTLKVKMGKENRLRNLNSPEDYKDYLRSLRAGPVKRPPSGKGRKKGPAPAPRKPSPRRAPGRPAAKHRAR